MKIMGWWIWSPPIDNNNNNESDIGTDLSKLQFNIVVKVMKWVLQPNGNLWVF